MDEGWVCVHRKLTEKGYYRNSQYVHLWLHLLLSANYRDKEFMWNGKDIRVKSGSFITGRKALSEATGIPPSTVEDILNYLESRQQIRQQKTTKYRLIEVLNWEKHQSLTPKATTEQQQSDTNNKVTKKQEYTPASQDLSDKSKNMKTYDESKHSDSDIPTVDNETGVVPLKVKAPNYTEAYNKLCKWAENQTGRRFTNLPKQYRALKEMRDLGLSPEDIQGKWLDVQSDKFWRDKQFDFSTVRSTIKMI